MQSAKAATAWLGRLSQAGGPRYLQIADFLENAIADGRLKAGDRLPAQREMAERLKVDLTTVTRAWNEARRRLLLEARGAHGTFVAAPKVDLDAMVDLSMNFPPPPAGLDLEELLRQGLAQVLLRADAELLMTYHPGGGSEVDRAAGARWLEPMLGPVADGLVTACPGAQAAIAALILAFTQPGDAVLAEPVNYPGLRSAARQLGRRLVDVETDDEGMRPDALERAAREHGATLVYLNPTIQNPTTRTMPERRRRAIARCMGKLGLRLIEDDPYWLLAERPPPPLARLAPERVHYVATLSKCLSPGLRTAFVAAPDASSEAAFLAALRSFSLMRTPLTAALVTQWLHDGTATRLMAGVRAEARARQRIAAQALATPLAGAHACRDGIHLWHELPGYWTAADFAREARAQGLAVTPGGAFATGRSVPNAIRISLGEGRDRVRLATALKKLSGLLARPPAAEHEAVV